LPIISLGKRVATPDAIDARRPPYRPGLSLPCSPARCCARSAQTLILGLLHVKFQPTVLGPIQHNALRAAAVPGRRERILIWLLVAPRPASVRWPATCTPWLVSTVVAVAAAEVGLRLVNPWGIELFRPVAVSHAGHDRQLDAWLPHTEVGLVSPGGNRVSLNSNGHRDDEMAGLEKGARRAAHPGLGDSVTFGWGVDQGEDFPARLEALLRDQPGGPGR